MTVVARSSRGRRAVVASSSCRRQAVVMPSVYRRRAVGTSSSRCQAIVVRPSAHCCRAVVSIVISTRRDFSYLTSACLLNYAELKWLTFFNSVKNCKINQLQTNKKSHKNKPPMKHILATGTIVTTPTTLELRLRPQLG